MNRLFFDTEFTDVREPKLLSIGLVSEDGESTCYLEISDQAHLGGANGFARDNVIPLFGRAQDAMVPTLRALGQRLSLFLASFSGPLELCYDYKADWKLLEQALQAAQRWRELAPRLRAYDVAEEVCSQEAVQAAEILYTRMDSPRHHALTKARVLRAKWLARPALDRSAFGQIRCFLGYHGLDHKGRSLHAIVSNSDEWMETYTSYVQWMFPIAEMSMRAQRAPMLTLDEFARLAEDERVRSGILLGVQRMLGFLGLRPDDQGRLAKAGNWATRRVEWARVPTHNDLRVSRMLRSMSLAGFKSEARELYIALEALLHEARGVAESEPALAYWRAAAFR